MRDVLVLVSHLVFSAAYGVSARAGRRFLGVCFFLFVFLLGFLSVVLACLTSVYAILILFFIICVIAISSVLEYFGRQ